LKKTTSFPLKCPGCYYKDVCQHKDKPTHPTCYTHKRTCDTYAGDNPIKGTYGNCTCGYVNFIHNYSVKPQGSQSVHMQGEQTVLDDFSAKEPVKNLLLVHSLNGHLTLEESERSSGSGCHEGAW